MREYRPTKKDFIDAIIALVTLIEEEAGPICDESSLDSYSALEDDYSTADRIRASSEARRAADLIRLWCRPNCEREIT